MTSSLSSPRPPNPDFSPSPPSDLIVVPSRLSQDIPDPIEPTPKPKAANPRGPRKPKVDENGDPIPPKPRGRKAAKKEESDDDEDDMEPVRQGGGGVKKEEDGYGGGGMSGVKDESEDEDDDE